MNQVRNFTEKYGVWILVFFHLAGLVGIIAFQREFFAALTPFMLALSVVILILAHRGNFSRLLLFFGAAYTLGYGVELLGTQTGLIFGEYRYGLSMAPLMAGVPLVIGLNWFLLALAGGFLSQKIYKTPVGQAIVGALLMVLVDFFIEPVAPKLDFWYWQTGEASWQNYLGWFFVALVMQIFFQMGIRWHQNKLAIPYFFTVFAFFVILTLAL